MLGHVLIPPNWKSVSTITGLLMEIGLCQICGQDSTKFMLLNEKFSSGSMWSRKRLTQIQAVARHYYLWLEMWIGMSKPAHKQEKPEWAVENPKLDNARKLRGFFFIDPEYEEYKETMKNARRNSKLLWKRLCFARWRQPNVFDELRETVSSGDTLPHKKTKCACGSPRIHNEAFGRKFSQINDSIQFGA